jgi:hypothetical protein
MALFESVSGISVARIIPPISSQRSFIRSPEGSAWVSLGLQYFTRYSCCVRLTVSRVLTMELPEPRDAQMPEFEMVIGGWF